jgi:cytoskeletal protein CcmA (bactofilin family)
MKLDPNPTEQSGTMNKLMNDVQIEGTLRFEHNLEFDGTIKGEIISEGTLVVGKNGKIEGEIKTHSVVVLGSVKGNINVKDRCVLKECSSVEGDVVSSLISIEEGAEFSGRSTIKRK